MNTDFDQLLARLEEGGVEFIVVGGMAGLMHGASRLTRDLDVVYARTPENLARLAAAIAPLHPRLRGAPAGLPFLWDAETLQRGLNFTLQCDLGELDVLGEIAGGGYTELRTHVVQVTRAGRKLLCLDLPTLIKVKRAAGRPKDFEAIAELEALLEERASGA